MDDQLRSLEQQNLAIDVMLRGDSHIDFPKISIVSTLRGGGVKTTDANFFSFIYRYNQQPFIKKIEV